MMKRFLLLIMCFTLVAPHTLAYASEQTEFSEELTAAMGLFNALNVTYDNLKDVDFSSGMTRAAFLMDLSKILNVKDKANTKLNYFKDMEGHWAFDVVNYFTEYGVITVSDDRLFRPDDFIKPSEAYKILITLTGYDAQAEIRGGYPVGYLVTANIINIVPNTVKNQEYLTVEDAYLLLYKAINIPLYEIKGVSGSDASYKVEKEKSLLSLYRDIYYDEGYVYSVNGLSLNNSKNRENEIMVNEERYLTDESLYTEYYLGKYVRLYYADDNKNKTVVYIRCDEKRGRYLEIDAKMVKGADDDYRLQYYNDDRFSATSTVRLSRAIYMIYNGKVVEKDYTKIINELKNGYVRLIDIDNDDVYEYAVVKNYTDFVVGFYDKQSGIIYDKLTDNKINFKECNIAGFYSSDYKKMGESSLAEGAVLSIAYSENNYFEGIISTNIISGKIDEIQDGRDTTYFWLGGKEYAVSSEYLEHFQSQFTVGDNVTVHFNAFSEAAYMKTKVNDDFSFGFLCDLNIVKGLTGFLQIKVFSKEGSIKVFDAAEKVVVDGALKRKAADIVSSIPGCSVNGLEVKCEPQAIRYKLNAEGKVREIDTKQLTKDESNRSSLIETVSYTHADSTNDMIVTSLGTNLRRLGVSTVIDASTLIFVVPPIDTIKSGKAEDYQYKLGTIANDLRTDTYVTSTSYRTDVLNATEELLLIYSEGKNEWNGRVNLMVVDSIIQGLDKNNTSVVRIKGMRGGKRVEYDIAPDSDITNLPDSGDTIGITTNALDQIISVKLIYNFSAGGTPKSQGLDWATDNRYIQGSYSQPFQCSFMYPSYKSGTVIRFCYDNTAADYLTNCIEAIDTRNYSIMVYDSKLAKNKLYLGSVNDILDIYSVGADECSRVLLHTRSRIIYDIIVYK